METDLTAYAKFSMNYHLADDYQETEQKAVRKVFRNQVPSWHLQ